MRLQLYEDGSVGYLNYDGDEKVNYKTGSPVVCTQSENENRDDFISKDNIKIRTNMYGSNEQLDKQVNDESWCVRIAVARQGYGLDYLVFDRDEQVRRELAEQGYGLDKLINDKDWYVRCAVARQNYSLDKLVTDEDWHVRFAVAWQGYGLDKLIDDEDKDVRNAVQQYLKDNNLTLSKWKKQHGIEDTAEVVKDFIYKVDESSKLEVKTEYESVDEFFAEPIANDVKLDTLVICAVDTKEPLIKLEKVNKDNQVDYKFIVDITNENGEDFIIRTFIKTQEHLNKQIEQTVEALRLYSQFVKYADDLNSCL